MQYPLSSFSRASKPVCYSETKDSNIQSRQDIEEANDKRSFAPFRDRDIFPVSDCHNSAMFPNDPKTLIAKGAQDALLPQKANDVKVKAGELGVETITKAPEIFDSENSTQDFWANTASSAGTQNRHEDFKCGKAESPKLGSTHVCVPNFAPSPESQLSEDTVVVRGRMRRCLPFKIKARVVRKVKEFSIKAKCIRKAFRKRSSEVKEASTKIDHTSFETLLQTQNRTEIPKSQVLEFWLNDTVAPLVKNSNVLERLFDHERNISHLNYKGPGPGDFQEISHQTDLQGDSVCIMEGKTHFSQWSKLLEKSKMDAVSRKVLRWVQKVRVGAKYRKSDLEFQSECGNLYDINWEYDFNPALYYAADANSDYGSEHLRSDDELVCGPRRISSSCSLYFSESTINVCGSETDGESRDNDSVSTIFDATEFRVIKPSGELGYPSLVGIFDKSKNKKTLSHMEKSSQENPELNSAALPVEIGDQSLMIFSKSHVKDLVTSTAETCGSFSENTDCLLKASKAENHEITVSSIEEIEELYTNKLATDSFSQSKDAGKRLAEIFKQYREGGFEQNDSPIAAVKKYTHLVNEVFKTAANERPLNLAEHFLIDKNLETVKLEPEPLDKTFVIYQPIPIFRNLQQISQRPYLLEDSKPIESAHTSEASEENEPPLFQNFEEEMVNPFFGEVVSKCSQGFMKEMKLVKKFFCKTAATKKATSASEAALFPVVSQVQSSETESPMESSMNVTAESYKSEEKSENEHQTEPFVSEAELSEAVEQTKISSPIETFESDKQVQKESLQKSWWKMPLWKKPTSEIPKTLWQELGLDEDETWKTITEDFSEGEDLHILREAQNNLPSLPSYSSVILQKANLANESSGSGAQKLSRISFAIKIEAMVFDEDETTEVTNLCNKVPSKSILKKPKVSSVAPLFESKRFKQTLSDTERNDLKIEISERIYECGSKLRNLRYSTKTEDVQDLIDCFATACQFSMKNHVQVADKQILEYTNYLAEIKSSIAAALDNLNATGNMLAILVDDIQSADNSETSLTEIDEKSKVLLQSLATSNAIIQKTQEAVTLLQNEDFDYVKVMLDLSNTALVIREEIRKHYKNFLEEYVKEKERKAWVHRISGVGQYVILSKSLAEKKQCDLETFENTLTDFQKSLEIAQEVSTEIENRTKMIIMGVVNLRNYSKDDQAVKELIAEAQQAANQAEDIERSNLSSQRNTEEMAVSQETSSRADIKIAETPMIPKQEDVQNQVPKTLELPKWLKFQGFGKKSL